MTLVDFADKPIVTMRLVMTKAGSAGSGYYVTNMRATGIQVCMYVCAIQRHTHARR